MMKYSLLLTYVFLASVSIASAAVQTSSYSGMTFKKLVEDKLIVLVNPLVLLLITATMFIFLFNLARYVWTAGDSKHHAASLSYMGWSLLALTVMFSLWGFVSIVRSILFGL